MSLSAICFFLFFLIVGLEKLGVGMPGWADIIAGIAALILAFLEITGWQIGQKPKQ